MFTFNFIHRNSTYNEASYKTPARLNRPLIDLMLKRSYREDRGGMQGVVFEENETSPSRAGALLNSKINDEEARRFQTFNIFSTDDGVTRIVLQKRYRKNNLRATHFTFKHFNYNEPLCIIKSFKFETLYSFVYDYLKVFRNRNDTLNELLTFMFDFRIKNKVSMTYKLLLSVE